MEAQLSASSLRPPSRPAGWHLGCVDTARWSILCTPPPTTHHRTPTTHHPRGRAIAIAIATATATAATLAIPTRALASATPARVTDQLSVYSFARNRAPPHVGADESRARVPSSAALER